MHERKKNPHAGFSPAFFQTVCDSCVGKAHLRRHANLWFARISRSRARRRKNNANHGDSRLNNLIHPHPSLSVLCDKYFLRAIVTSSVRYVVHALLFEMNWFITDSSYPKYNNNNVRFSSGFPRIPELMPAFPTGISRSSSGFPRIPELMPAFPTGISRFSKTADR